MPAGYPDASIPEVELDTSHPASLVRSRPTELGSAPIDREDRAAEAQTHEVVAAGLAYVPHRLDPEQSRRSPLPYTG